MNASPQIPHRIPHRILHTMLRVSNLENSLKFYELLGLKELRREDFPEAEFSLSFIGYGAESTHSVIELTYNYGNHSYDIGTAYGHIALAVENIYDACVRLKNNGVKITRQPGPMKAIGSSGKPETIAFIEDPDGYKIELIECGK